MGTTPLKKHISLLAAWALAFGCSVGWDASVIPWTTFLPKSGPLGTSVGLLLGAIAMIPIVWNYHYMINRQPGSGGVYSYVSSTFGHDHGFICGWFFVLANAAIVWSDATAMSIIVRYIFGDVFHFGFKYTVSGFEVCLGDVVVAFATAGVVAAVCCRRSLSFRLQTVLAIVFGVGFLACFAATAIRHGGGAAAMAPAFAPEGDGSVVQVMQMLAMAPWLFVGFEAVSNISDECGFPLRKSFGVMVAVLVAALVVYMALAAIPVLAPGQGCARWTDAVAGMCEPNAHAFDAAKRSLGFAGTAVISCTLLGAIFTNLIGNTIVASRLLAAMAEDGVMPRWLSRRSEDGTPRNAVLAVAGLAMFTTFLGQTVIDIIFDTALVGATIAYAYTSAATLKLARTDGDRRAQASGLVGLATASVMVMLFALPICTPSTMMSNTSYLVLIFECLVGLAFFILAFRHDDLHRLGRSASVWITVNAVVIFMAVLWVRQTTYATTTGAFGELAELSPASDVSSWKSAVCDKLASTNGLILRNSLVQIGIIVFTLALMGCLSCILRRRERILEEEKTKAKSYFFSTVSHDIRTPLNAIIGFSEMLKSGFKAKEEQDHAIDSIIVSGRTLLALINDVLDLSKLESGKMSILPEPTDCQKLLKGVVDAFRVSSVTGTELRCRVERMPPLMLDPQRLRQVVFNLVGNAVKFTEHGYVELRSSFRRDDGARSGVFTIEVEDTGCGISESDLKRLGMAYVQVGSSLSRNGGTGLGLAICHQLASAMGGRLTVASELGRGSTFTLVLDNVAVAAEPESGGDAGASVAAAGASGDEPSAPAESESSGPAIPAVRILIVDDSKLNRMVLKAMLKNAGVTDVEMATDGQDALDKLKGSDARPYDLVLTDMWMPNLDGKGLASAIRTDAALSSLCVVAVTADVELQDKAEEFGFDEIALKPVTPQNLGKILSKALSKRRR